MKIPRVSQISRDYLVIMQVIVHYGGDIFQVKIFLESENWG